jgi:hypothetical protein
MRVIVQLLALMLWVVPAFGADQSAGLPKGLTGRFVIGRAPQLPNGGRPRTKTPMPVIANWKTLKISLERTICYGSCPYYKVEIAGDGTVYYTGLDHVAVTGRHRAQVSPDAVGALYQAFLKADFFWTLDTYAASVTDVPTYTVTISYDGHSKKLVDYYGREIGMPKQITALEDGIDAMAQTEKWVKGSGDTFASLIAEHWDFRATDDEHLKLIETAVRRNDTDFVKKLLAAGLSAKSEHGCTGMAYAASKNNMEMVDVLIAAGAPLHWGVVQEPYPHDCNVVEWAVEAQSDALPMVRRLLSRHPHLNQQNESGETALMKAAEFSSAPVIQLLLEHGADPWIVDKEGKIAVDYVRGPHPEKSDAVRVMRRWMATHKKPH